MSEAIRNPYRPGAGHFPPYLAGRDRERKEFARLLRQDVVLQNLLITGLRGVGKTVLMESLKPISTRERWIWVGADLSESASLSEDTLVERIVTDLAAHTATLSIPLASARRIGFTGRVDRVPFRLDHDGLHAIMRGIPGMISDKFKGMLEFVWRIASSNELKGIILAYDEAQVISDHPDKGQYPVAMLLDVFQSLQRKNVNIMLLLSGLPTLFPRLVRSRTFAERMFTTLELRRLSDEDSRKAITEPLVQIPDEYRFSKKSVDAIVKTSSGYPYFIQFICREVCDIFMQHGSGRRPSTIPMDDIIKKLDADFYAGRWARATDRQRDFLKIVAALPSRNEEFTVQEIVGKARETRDIRKPFSPSHIVQILNILADRGLVYKNRHGKYVFAVPLFGDFIRRTMSGD